MKKVKSVILRHFKVDRDEFHKGDIISFDQDKHERFKSHGWVRALGDVSISPDAKTPEDIILSVDNVLMGHKTIVQQ